MKQNNGYNFYSRFDLLTTEEIEDWARFRDAINMPSSSVDRRKAIVEHIEFNKMLNMKYNVYFTVIGFDSYIKARRRADKLSGITDNNPY
jgi:hypothetical protein